MQYGLPERRQNRQSMINTYQEFSTRVTMAEKGAKWCKVQFSQARFAERLAGEGSEEPSRGTQQSRYTASVSIGLQ